MKYGTPAFSPDGKRLGYPAKSGEKEFVVVDAKKGDGYDSVGFPVFSPNSRSAAYALQRGTKWSVVIDEKQGEAFDSVAALVFSPDSKRLAYVGFKDRKSFVVVDGRLSGAYDYVGGTPVWHGALAVHDKGKEISLSISPGGKFIVGQSTPVLTQPLVSFNSDSSKVAFGARDGRQLKWETMDVSK